jgi:hypothetical protein
VKEVKLLDVGGNVNYKNINMAKKKKKGPSCWKGYRAAGKKKSPSGKKTRGGRTKMVNNCVKIKKR